MITQGEDLSSLVIERLKNGGRGIHPVTLLLLQPSVTPERDSQGGYSSQGYSSHLYLLPLFNKKLWLSAFWGLLFFKDLFERYK